MHDRAASDGTVAASMLGLVRPVRRCRTAKSDERSPGRDPIRAGTRRIVLGSAGHLERLQTSRRRRKNSRWRLKKLGFGKKVKTIKSGVCIDFDRLDVLNRP